MADHLPKNIREIMTKLRQKAPEHEKLIMALYRALAGMVPATNDGVLHVEAMIAMLTKQPMVTFRWGTNKGELTPIEARQHAMHILQACEAAIQDAAIFRAFQNADKDPVKAEKMASHVISMVRLNRAKFEEGGN